MAKTVRKYEDFLAETLKNPKQAAAYLNAHLQNDEDDHEALFLMALRDVAKVYGFAEVSEKTKLGRESLYKALSADGNPKLTTLISLLKVMGLKLTVGVDKKKVS